MSPPVGPTGCTATGDRNLRFGLGFAYGFSDTRLLFVPTGGEDRGQTRYRFRQAAYTLSFVAALKSGVVLGVGLGAHAGGQIDGRRGLDEQWTIRPGVVWSLTVARRWFGTEPQIPFLLVAGTFSGSSASTVRLSDDQRAGLHAFDARADVSVGWTLGEAFSPYLSVRGFGGPVLWKQDQQALLGGDLYHVSLACGFNLVMDERFTAYFDGAFVGMRSLGGGVGVRF